MKINQNERCCATNDDNVGMDHSAANFEANKFTSVNEPHSDLFCGMQRKYKSSPKSTDVINSDIMLMFFCFFFWATQLKSTDFLVIQSTRVRSVADFN